MKTDAQAEKWSSEFGKDYTDRNLFSPAQLDSSYKDKYGVTRSEMNSRFLKGLGLEHKRILEVGCNVGNQLRMLQQQGFTDLYGVELQDYAVEKAKETTRGINIMRGTADGLPFKDSYFDMVFTSGVLIHISPKNVGGVMDEIVRATRHYVWGFEYYADKYTEIAYRGNKDLLWKADFSRVYRERHPELALIKEGKFKYLADNNVDSMFLLEKR